MTRTADNSCYLTDKPLSEGLCSVLGPGWCEVPSCAAVLQCWWVLVGRGRVFHAVPPLHHTADWFAPHSGWCTVYIPQLAWQLHPTSFSITVSSQGSQMHSGHSMPPTAFKNKIFHIAYIIHEHTAYSLPLDTSDLLTTYSTV